MLTKQVMFYRVRDLDALEAMRNWAKRLQSDLNEEAIQTLGEENCISESLYLLTSQKEKFGMFIGVFDGEKKPPNMQREINKLHFQFFDVAFLNVVMPFPIFTEIECIYQLNKDSTDFKHEAL